MSKSMYRIISFDGGGVRGALTATLLTRLSERFTQLIRGADLMAGTSVGAALAPALAAGSEPADLAEAFGSEESWRYIFSPRRPNLNRPKYEFDHLTAILERLFPDPHLALSGLEQPVMVTAFQLEGPDGGPWQPVLMHNLPGSDTSGVSLLDATLRSCVAPTYFPSYQGFVDGGVFANNPGASVLALAAGPESGVDAGRIALLSFGTGQTPAFLAGGTEHWGLRQWALNPDPPPASPIFSVLFDGDVLADTLTASQLLGDRFIASIPSCPSPWIWMPTKRCPRSKNSGRSTIWRRRRDGSMNTGPRSGL